MKSKKSGNLTFGIVNFSSLNSLKKGCNNASNGLNLSLGGYTINFDIKSTNSGSGLNF